MDDLALGRVFAIMRSHDSARKEGDLRNLKVAPVHNVPRKPERAKPQHVAEAARKEPDLEMAEKLQDTTEPDLTAAEEILDTMEPGPLAWRKDASKPFLIKTGRADA